MIGFEQHYRVEPEIAATRKQMLLEGTSLGSLYRLTLDEMKAMAAEQPTPDPKKQSIRT